MIDTKKHKEQFVELPRIIDRRGNLSIIEAQQHVPFNISRAYWIYDVPGGQKRGSHAFRRQHEVIVALSGSFDVLLNDGKSKRKYTLNRAYQALYIPHMMWRTLENFSTNSVCLVLSSDTYNEADYIRNYKHFKEEIGRQESPLLKEASLRGELVKTLSENEYNSVFDCSLIEFPVIRNRAGNITPVHSGQHIPFDIKRVFFIYDIPCASERGMHAHKQCHEILIATSGSFDVELDDGTNKRTVTLNRPMCGLHIPPGVWATEKNYSSGVVCLVLASEAYQEADYISSYVGFKAYRRHEN